MMNIDYNSIDFHSLIKSPKLKQIISELISIYLNLDEILRTAKLNELLIRIMVELVENHSDLNSALSPKSKTFDTVIATIQYIHNNFDKKITLSEIAKVVLYDKYALCREFKKHTGQTIFEYLNHYRSLKAIDYLSKGYTVSKTAEFCGFENLSLFTKTFKKYIGNTPSEHKTNTRLY